ncbi:MAG: hypothetical protein ACTSPK_06650 [Candidatus Heimdallarchaeota archaeon]
MSFFRRLFSKKKKEKPKRPVQRPKKEILKPNKDGMVVKVMPIEKFNAPKIIKEGEVLKIQAMGHFTSAGWKLKETYAKVKDDKIIFAVVGHMKANMMSAQVLKKFDTVIQLVGLKKGIYYIKPEKGMMDQTQLTVE